MRRWILRLGLSLAVLLGLVTLIGWTLPSSHVASVRAAYSQPPEVVWETITDIGAAPAWRSGLNGTERLADRNGNPVWVESYRDGGLTYEIVELRPPRRMVQRIADENLPFGGSWTYEITPSEAGCTLTLTENGEIDNPIFRFVTRFVMGYHSTMETYLRDLAAKYGEETAPQRVE